MIKYKKLKIKRRTTLDKQDNKYMKEALKEAQKSYNKEEIPVGAVIVKDGKIIGRGHNLKETKNDTTNHVNIIQT